MGILTFDIRSAGRRIMKKAFFTIVYVVLSVTTFILAAGGPVAFTGSGGGG